MSGHTQERKGSRHSHPPTDTHPMPPVGLGLREGRSCSPRREVGAEFLHFSKVTQLLPRSQARLSAGPEALSPASP